MDRDLMLRISSLEIGEGVSLDPLAALDTALRKRLLEHDECPEYDGRDRDASARERLELRERPEVVGDEEVSPFLPGEDGTASLPFVDSTGLNCSPICSLSPRRRARLHAANCLKW